MKNKQKQYEPVIRVSISLNVSEQETPQPGTKISTRRFVYVKATDALLGCAYNIVHCIPKGGT